MQPMQGSASEHSYAQNSGSQNSLFHSVAKPCLGDAIKHMVCKSLLNVHTPGVEAGRVVPRYHIAVADLGCSFGRNTLDCAEFVVRALHENLASAEEDASSSHNIMELQYFFSDLPSNDFNALFQSLHSYLPIRFQSSPLPKFFAAGVPGSFHDRLFPTASLDLAISCVSLHWLSQGLMASEEMDMFNMMFYFMKQQELESVVKEVPELRVLHMETVKDVLRFPEGGAEQKEMVEQWVGMLCSTIKLAVDTHVGKSKSDEIFKRLKTKYLNPCFNIIARLSHTDLVVASLQRL